MKNIFNIIILFLCILILGCTITKRKYTGGYYIHQKGKFSKTYNFTSNEKRSISNKNTKTNTETCLRPISKAKAGEAAIGTLQPLEPIAKGTENITVPSFIKGDRITLQNYISEQDTVTEHVNSTKNESKKDDRYARAFFIFGLLLGLIFLYVVAHILYFNTSESSISIILLLPVIFFLISVIHAFRAIIHANKWGEIVFVIFGILFLAFLLFAIIDAFIE